MGISFRHYLFAEDGILKRVPRRICEALPFGKDAIPEFAESRQRVVQVLIDNEDGRPVRILDATGHFWTFDAEGKIDTSLRESMGEWMEVAFAKPTSAEGKIVDLVPEIKKKGLHDRHRWTLTNENMDRIAADIWPGINGPAIEVTTVKGVAPKKPSLSYEAKHALQEISDKLEMIKYELARLSEHSLKGFEFEALRTATYEDEDLWRGIAAAAKERRAILAAYRTGKGKWVVSVEAIRSETPIIEKTVANVHEECPTREAAVEAGRRLMNEKAGWLGPETRLEVTVFSELEWHDRDD